MTDPASLDAMADRMQAVAPDRPVLMLATLRGWHGLPPAVRARWRELRRTPAGVLAQFR